LFGKQNNTESNLDYSAYVLGNHSGVERPLF
jgi:hypothetical protein